MFIGLILLTFNQFQACLRVTNVNEAKKLRPIQAACRILQESAWKNINVAGRSHEVRSTIITSASFLTSNCPDGISIIADRRNDGPKGLGDFQRRSNRDGRYDRGRRDYNDRGREDYRRGDRNDRGWDATPRGGATPRANGDAPSVRVPNVAWDSTPRHSRDDDVGYSANRRWDAPTPRISRDSTPDLETREWEEEQVKLDRDWYSWEEGGVAGDEEHNPLAQYEDLSLLKEKEIQAKSVKKISARQAQYNKDNDLWEANRMLTSGVATRRTLDLDFEDESESTVHVMVHDLKPPFLDGRTVFTKQLDTINPIRDPTSDMAIFSKKGSALVKEKREQAERAKAAAKLAALGGTSLGNIMGVRDEEAEAEGMFDLAMSRRVCVSFT